MVTLPQTGFTNGLWSAEGRKDCVPHGQLHLSLLSGKGQGNEPMLIISSGRPQD